jgi:hypothetical protein
LHLLLPFYHASTTLEKICEATKKQYITTKLFLIYIQFMYTNRSNRRYKLTFYATDGTAEAEMFCFDSVARQIVGKPCEFLIKSMDVSISTPSDLCAIIGLKFTFAINININSYFFLLSNKSLITQEKEIFNVNSIVKAHGRQEAISDVHKNVH